MPLIQINNFLHHLSTAIYEEQFVKLTLSDRRDKNSELKNVFIKPVQLKAGLHLSFIYRYPTKDVTKNFTQKEATPLLRAMLQNDFYKADLFSSTIHYNLSISKTDKATITQKASADFKIADTTHDKEKRRFIRAEYNIYLNKLGVTSAEGKVKSDKQDKFKQINKYVEIVESVVGSASLPDKFRVADMGAGKGYLTFALYDHLTNTMNLHPQVTGVEMRQGLVDDCNKIAEQAGFEHLHFNAGSIEHADIPDTDMLIALHACDIATDQAIYRGITSNAQVIICAPCCHKQVRKQLHPANDLKAITKFGILEERQAEILTDTIRALILEAYGYKTKVFEFISTEHTPKNVIITAVKTPKSPQGDFEKDQSKTAIGTLQVIDAGKLEQVKNLKAMFNIEYHHLEKLMGI